MPKESASKLIIRSEPEVNMRREILKWLGISIGLASIPATGEILWFFNEYKNRLPQKMAVNQNAPVATGTSTATSTATQTATATETRKPPTAPPRFTATPEFPRTYQLTELNLQGIGSYEKGKLQPAPDLKGKITPPNNQGIDFFVAKPRALLPGEDMGKASDWRNPDTISYPNSENPDANFIIQVGHTGTYRDEKGISRFLPVEQFRRALEANSRSFTQVELDKTINDFKSARVVLSQDKTSVEAKIKAIVRLSPKQTSELAGVYSSGGDRDILKFANQDFRVDPKKEFCLLICGQNLLPGEKATPNVEFYLQTRYFVFFSLLT